MSADPRAVIREAEAEAYLRLRSGTLRKWRRFGRGPKAIIIGRRYVRFRIEDLDAFMAANVEDPTSRAK